jgi:subtilisin family serine protease
MDQGGPAPGFPASLDGVIAVLETDPDGAVRWPEGLTRSDLVAAPGVDVLTTAPHGAYDFRSGTSLAAAHVSGVAALLLEREPRLTPAEVRALILSTARPAASGPGGVATAGRVDACAAVAALVRGLACP